MRAAVSAALVLVLAAAVSAQVPIPSRPDGFAYANGSPAAPLQIDLFVDLLCPDSQAIWPTLKQVADHYGAPTLRLVTHIFPLPYHHNAYYAAQGTQVVAAANVNAVYKWLDAVFAAQDSFEDDPTVNLTSNQVINMYAALSQTIGVPAAVFLKGMDSDDTDESARIAWKYGCTRGVAGTPWFFVNGISVAASSAWSVSDWVSVLDPLLNSSITRCDSTHRIRYGSLVTDCPAGEIVCNFLPGQSQCCLAGENCVPNVGCRC
ncbi:hypothetical protein CAOG_04686 [Capsaspora owczarzaki ATCC 30864]|uniref:DSBA-like thioredoxin domain-containing protein n=1 Tax=Capsaspora owczarzaki (strain ATCC 30864) TaxID=595528 RepID=A0A0D2VSC9_CAPO3|nr:hypothetical protein CAOG_04686 [Capsaspora owczarzaki ATCC 30864]KJE93977.1 hypothetical protein CAOG_004686 [Capsaspora owczarzaki ATCC 30864]|eukprot:XP_004347433.1 hypothetical protein CAOG_04686 [Capsaspora owczarzaki ATCC 30864]